MSTAYASDVECPVCKSDLQMSGMRCATCRRPLVRVPWLAPMTGSDGTLLPLSSLAVISSITAMALSFVWLLVARQAGWNTLTPVLALAGCFIPLSLVLGFDGIMSLVSGIDKTKAHLSEGTEARISGGFKLALAVSLLGLTVWAMRALPGFGIV